MGVISGLKKNTKNGTDRHTHTHTDGHLDSKTESAQRANSVKILHTGDTKFLNMCG